MHIYWSSYLSRRDRFTVIMMNNFNLSLSEQTDKIVKKKKTENKEDLKI